MSNYAHAAAVDFISSGLEAVQATAISLANEGSIAENEFDLAVALLRKRCIVAIFHHTNSRYNASSTNRVGLLTIAMINQ